MVSRLRDNPGLFLSLACLVLFAVAWATAWGFPERARIFPLYMVAIGIGVVLLQIAFELWKPIPAEQRTSGADLGAEDDYTLGTATRHAAREYAWIVGLFVLVYVIGPVIALPTYVVAYARSSAGVGWRTAALMGLGLFVIIIGVFEHLLHLSWPRGIVPQPQRILLEFLRGLGV